MQRITRGLAMLAGTLAVAPLAAQGPTPLAVGAAAPAFTLGSATATGVGPKVSLADFRGQTVVLAFFFQARTKG